MVFYNYNYSIRNKGSIPTFPMENKETKPVYKNLNTTTTSGKV